MFATCVVNIEQRHITHLVDISFHGERARYQIDVMQKVSLNETRQCILVASIIDTRTYARTHIRASYRSSIIGLIELALAQRDGWSCVVQRRADETRVVVDDAQTRLGTRRASSTTTA